MLSSKKALAKSGLFAKHYDGGIAKSGGAAPTDVLPHLLLGKIAQIMRAATLAR